MCTWWWDATRIRIRLGKNFWLLFFKLSEFIDRNRKLFYPDFSTWSLTQNITKFILKMPRPSSRPTARHQRRLIWAPTQCNSTWWEISTVLWTCEASFIAINSISQTLVKFFHCLNLCTLPTPCECRRRNRKLSLGI